MGRPDRWNSLKTGIGVERRSFWLRSGSSHLPVWLHLPDSANALRAAAVICPPVGYEYAHSYRSLLHLADALAVRGLATVRFDYFGTGTAPGDAFDSGLVPQWIADVSAAVALANTVSASDRCHLIGLQLGATLAASAAANTAVESLVLWAPVVRGRQFVRERRLLAGMAPQKEDPTYFDAGGFVLSSESAAAIGALDLTKQHYLVRAGVLVVQREDIPVSANLRGAIEAHGISMELASPGGYLEMMAEPQYTVVPQRAIEEIGRWIIDRGGSARATTVSEPRLADASVTVSPDSGGHSEELVVIRGEPGLHGVLTTPANTERPRSAVLLANAGSVHQVGPNRVYVELSRALAAAGTASLRIDLRNLGDSIVSGTAEENHPYPSTVVADVQAAIRWLSRRGYPDVIVGGLCSGAYSAFRAGLDLPDVRPRGLVLVNPLTFRWAEGMTLDTPDSYATAAQASHYRRAMRDRASWQRLLKGKVRYGRFGSFLVRRASDLLKSWIGGWLRRRGILRDTLLSRDILTLDRAGVSLDFFFAASDPGLEILRREGGRAVAACQRSGSLTITTIRGADHTFSKLDRRRDFISSCVQRIESRLTSTEPRSGVALASPPLERVIVPYGPELWEKVEPTWTHLYDAVGATSPFLSALWMGSWMRTFGDLMRPAGYVWMDATGNAVACAIVSLKLSKVGPFRVRKAFLNATGEGAISTEHNDLLVLPEHRVAVIADIVSQVRTRGADQLILEGVEEDTTLEVMEAWPADEWDGYWSESPFVDLHALASGTADYLSALSAGTRSQIRRSISLYARRFGPPEVRIARAREEAQAWLESLIDMHRSRWTSRGQRGAFATKRIMDFHDGLFRHAFEPGARPRVDLVRVSFGTEPVGFLYNFRHAGKVSFYQSGFRYEGDNRLKPGLVTHALSIQHYLDIGEAEYDFLAGEHQPVRYKRSLATGRRTIAWAELTFPKPRMHVILGLRRLARRERRR